MCGGVYGGVKVYVISALGCVWRCVQCMISPYIPLPSLRVHSSIPHTCVHPSSHCCVLRFNDSMR